MKLIKISVLALASWLLVSPLNEVQAKEKTAKVAVQKSTTKTKKSKKAVRTSVKKAKKNTASSPNETKKLYGVKGAKLKHVKISTSQRSYREKGKSHKIIGVEASRQYGQVGMASYYGGMFNGRKTANGEIFNENKFTAAHKTLALGSYALVTNLRNGRKIVVRINDRGPFSGTRILDLSKGAARELGMIQSGVAKVRVEAMQVDRQGYIIGKGAESLYQIAKRSGLPLKVKGEGKNFGFKADPNPRAKSEVKMAKQAVSSVKKFVKNGVTAKAGKKVPQQAVDLAKKSAKNSKTAHKPQAKATKTARAKSSKKSTSK